MYVASSAFRVDGSAPCHPTDVPRNKDDFFDRAVQRYIAVNVIGPSTLGAHGSSGAMRAAQNYLAAAELSGFKARTEDEFLGELNAQTERLRATLPPGGQHWGSARKALNLFLREVWNNRFLCQRYALGPSEEWLEVPLDRWIVSVLKREAGRGKLTAWPGLNLLTADVNASFQAFARTVAAGKGIARVHLDICLWAEAIESSGEPQDSAAATDVALSPGTDRTDAG